MNLNVHKLDIFIVIIIIMKYVPAIKQNDTYMRFHALITKVLDMFEFGKVLKVSRERSSKAYNKPEQNKTRVIDVMPYFFLYSVEKPRPLIFLP